MGKTMTNLSIVLGLITVAFAGYYLYLQKDSSTLNIESSEETMQNMMNKTQKFIQHRQTLDKVRLDMNIFEDKRFVSLRSFSTPIEEQPIGRPDPFADREEVETDSI